VRDDLRNFRCDDESFRRFISPSDHRGSSGRGIKSGINLHRLKSRSVVAQVIRGLHSCGIERSVPARRGECRCPEINRSVHAPSISRSNAPSRGGVNKFSNAHRNVPLCFSTWLPIIVEMINGFKIGANEGGQQPSELVCLANREMPCAHMPPSDKISRKYLTKPAATRTSLTETGSQTESDVSYRKQRTDSFLTETRTARCRSGFSAPGARLFAAPQRMISGPRTRRQTVTRASREEINCVALPQRNIQNLCGTIVFSAIVRPHGISGVV